MRKPLAIDLFTGLHGWAEGLVAEGYDVIGFDLEDMCGQFNQPRPAHVHLVLQDVRTLHGSQFKDAALIVASPPCQAYSYRAMPWKRAKALPPPDNTLFNECFRIQREACEAAGHHIPLIVENVRGAQKWVGRARWNYGSFYLWGDVPALMPSAKAIKVSTMGAGWYAPGHPKHVPGLAFNTHAERATKNPGFRFDGSGRSFQSASVEGLKGVPHRTAGDWTNPAEHEGRKFTIAPKGSASKATRDPVAASHGAARKFASAMIAKIPLPLSRHIGAVFHPRELRKIA